MTQLPKGRGKTKARLRARPTSGEKKAIAIALDANGDVNEVEDVQPDLLGLENKNVLRLRERQGRTGGRPAGARNRRTVEMANYLLSRYTSPLEILAQIATSRVDELSVSLGCTKIEAMQEIRLAALGLIPYVHSKMPVAIDVTNKREIHLTIVEGMIPDETDDDGVGLVNLVAQDITPKDHS